MKGRANFYFSILVVSVAGVIAMSAIIYVATKPAPPQTSSTTSSTVGGTESSFRELQQSILNP